MPSINWRCLFFLLQKKDDPMKTVLQKIAFIVVAFCSFAAVAGKDRGGGDEIGLDFRRAFKAAMSEIQTDLPELHRQIEVADLDEVVKRIKILVTNEPLYAVVDGVQQEWAVANEPERMLVIINRQRWSA